MFSYQPATADLLKLMNGGELRGKVVQNADQKQMIQLETTTGATVIVNRDQTQFVTLRSATIEEYETRSRQINDDWESHWELAEWCRQKGLVKQRETQMLRVVELNPEHDKAQMALGRTWHKGSWVDRHELMTSQGYVKYKNRYILPQELEVIERSADELKHERSWFPKVRLWVGWLDGSEGTRSRQAVSELKKIDDPHAATAVIKFLSGDSRVAVRELSVQILINISGSKAIAGLVRMALYDESEDVRERALQGIGPDFYQNAQPIFVAALKNESNAVVCRAAMALEKIGDKKVVSPLIDALVTIHQYQVAMDVPKNQIYSFTTDGNFAQTGTPLPPDLMAAVRTGHMNAPIVVPTDAPPKKMVTVRVEHQNAEVLKALEKLTDKNFGFDKRTWNLWWSAEKNQGGKLAK